MSDVFEDYFKSDLDIIEEWIDALRSGKYTQTQNALHDPVVCGFCCLGVLCDLNKDANSYWVEGEFRHLIMPSGWELFEPTDLPVRFKDLLSRAALQVADENKLQHSFFANPAALPSMLVQLNDRHGFDFSQIADLLDAIYFGGPEDRVKIAELITAGSQTKKNVLTQINYPEPE